MTLKLTKTDPSLRVEAKGDSVDLDILDVIGDYFGEGVSAKMVRDALKPHAKAKTINVTINSPGGSAWDGIGIYNLLREHKANVNVRIVGLAASAASVIAMAGDEIVVDEGSSMMIHNSAGLCMGHASDMIKVAATLEKLDGQIAAVYAARTGGDKETIAEQMSETTWFTAEEAVEDGFATSVNPAKTKPIACFDPRILTTMNNVPDDVVERFFQRAGDETPATDTENNDMTPEQFAEKNPQSIEKWKADGSAQNMAEEKQRAEQLRDAFPDDPKFALDQFIAGHGVSGAKAEYADRLAEQLKTEREARAEAEAKLAKADEGAEPLHLGEAGKPGDDEDPKRAKVQAEAAKMVPRVRNEFIRSMGYKPGDFQFDD